MNSEQTLRESDDATFGNWYSLLEIGENWNAPVQALRAWHTNLLCSIAHHSDIPHATLCNLSVRIYAYGTITMARLAGLQC